LLNVKVNNFSTMKTKNITSQNLAISIVLMIALGTWIRFYNLTLKMVWADEIASIVHGLGNSFTDISSNQIINLTDLLKILEIDKAHGLVEVVKHGIFEDFVPPLHFMLLHLWILLFDTSGQLVDIFTIRSISACFSILSISTIYLLAKSLFPRSRSTWLLSTLLITLSPYSISLAQEVRHYSTSIFLVILSMLVFFQLTQQIIQKKPLSLIKASVLFGLNLLGVASHFFFVIVIAAEMLTIIIIAYQFQLKSARTKISIVILLNLVTLLVWMPVYFLNNSRDDLTTWAQMDITKIDVIASLFLQLLVSSITMIILLPVESSNTFAAVFSALIMLSTMGATIWAIVRSSSHSENKYYEMPLRFLQTYLLASMLLLVAVSWVFKKDFLSSPRYHFIYFPAVVILVGYFINSAFFVDQSRPTLEKIGIRKNLILYLFGFILFASSLSVVNNLSFLKPFHADLMAKIINDNSVQNTIIVTTNQNLIDTSHIMALGWQLAHDQNQHVIPRFFLDKSSSRDAARLASSRSRDILIQNALQSSESSSLWLINYADDIDLENCDLKKDDTSLPRSHYKYYACR
jgi:uncharacterized membrane protein